MSTDGAPSGIDSTPELVVKIVGSKHIKYFIDRPRQTKDIRLISDPMPSIQRETQKEPPDKQGATIQTPAQHEPVGARGTTDKQASARWGVNCVTAPSGDQTLSYIHCQHAAAHGNSSHLAWEGHATNRQGGGLRELGPLATVVRQDLHGWKTVDLQSIGEELRELDHTYSGTIHQSQLSLVFLQQDVPLMLPTLRLLFQTFADPSHPGQVHYRQLLDFISGAIETEGPELHTGPLDHERTGIAGTFENHEDTKLPHQPQQGNGNREQLSFHESDMNNNGLLATEKVLHEGSKKGSQVHRFSKSTGSNRVMGDTGYPPDSETWLQRFQRMEKAMHMYDYKSTGYLEKDEAKRLLHNYNLIFNLNLSPLKISEALRRFQSGGNVALDPLMQFLKEL
ncbi:uncharacterized protein C1orf87 homolog isoform X2 [Amia ocellicauda]